MKHFLKRLLEYVAMVLIACIFVWIVCIRPQLQKNHISDQVDDLRAEQKELDQRVETMKRGELSPRQITQLKMDVAKFQKHIDQTPRQSWYARFLPDR